MTTDPRAETIGLTLLGLALLVLTLSLRGAQPGLALSPPYPLLAAAAVAYLAASLLLTQSPLHAALAFSLMLAAHVLYATLMVAAFSLNEQAQPTGQQPREGGAP